MRLIPEAWPGALQTVARLLGDEAAAAVARGLGGRRLYLSADPGPTHPLSQAVGRRGARLVAAHLVGQRGDHVDWPAARALIRMLEARELKAAGKSEAQIARVLGVTQRHVRHLVGHLPKGVSDGAATFIVQEAVCPECGRRLGRKSHPPASTVPDDRQIPLPL